MLTIHYNRLFIGPNMSKAPLHTKRSHDHVESGASLFCSEIRDLKKKPEEYKRKQSTGSGREAPL